MHHQMKQSGCPVCVCGTAAARVAAGIGRSVQHPRQLLVAGFAALALRSCCALLPCSMALYGLPGPLPAGSCLAAWQAGTHRHWSRCMLTWPQQEACGWRAVRWSQQLCDGQQCGTYQRGCGGLDRPKLLVVTLRIGSSGRMRMESPLCKH